MVGSMYSQFFKHLHRMGLSIRRGTIIFKLESEGRLEAIAVGIVPNAFIALYFAKDCFVII